MPNLALFNIGRDIAAREARGWDEPELDEVMLEGLEARQRREQQ